MNSIKLLVILVYENYIASYVNVKKLRSVL